MMTEQDGHRNHKDEGVETGSPMAATVKSPVSPSGEYARSLFRRHDRVSSVAPLSQQIFNRYKTSVKPLGGLPGLPLVQARSIRGQETQEDSKPDMSGSVRKAVLKTDSAVQAVNLKTDDRAVVHAGTAVKAVPAGYGEKRDLNLAQPIAHARHEGKAEGPRDYFPVGSPLATGLGQNVSENPVRRVMAISTNRVLRKIGPVSTSSEAQLPLTWPKIVKRTTTADGASDIPVQQVFSGDPHPYSVVGDVQMKCENAASVQHGLSGSAERPPLTIKASPVAGYETKSVSPGESGDTGFEPMTVKQHQGPVSKKGHLGQAVSLHMMAGDSPPYVPSDLSRPQFVGIPGREAGTVGHLGPVTHERPAMVFRKEFSEPSLAHGKSSGADVSEPVHMKLETGTTGAGIETVNVNTHLQAGSPGNGMGHRPLVKVNVLETGGGSLKPKRLTEMAPRINVRRQTAPVSSVSGQVSQGAGRETLRFRPMITVHPMNGIVRRLMESVKPDLSNPDSPSISNGSEIYAVGQSNFQTPWESRASFLGQDRVAIEPAAQHGSVKRAWSQHPTGIRFSSVQRKESPVQRTSVGAPGQEQTWGTALPMPLGINRHTVVEQVVGRIENRLSRRAETAYENSTGMLSPALPSLDPSSETLVGTRVDQPLMDIRHMADQVYDLIMERLSIERESLGL